MEWFSGNTASRGQFKTKYMKIGIDISQIVYGTGVSVYTKNLVNSLLKIDKENEYVLFGASLRRRKEILEAFPQAKVVPIPPTAADIIWNKFHTFPIEKLIGQVDVFHTSDWTEPPANAFKVTTVHDLYPLKFPKLVHPKILDVHRGKLYWVKKESRRIIVPSQSTKSDLVGLGFDENIIRVIPEAPTLRKASDERISEAKKKYQIRGDYLMSIGVTTLKNTKKIIKAFHLATAGKEVKLVIAGRPSGINIEPERNVRMLGHIPQEDLEALLSGSRGLIFASLYEGYGIPILDAFACGVPVVTSTVGSMPEVAGDSAILVDPADVNSIAEGITKVVRGAKAQVQKGEKWVQNFSWEKTAEMTLNVYREAR